MKDKIAIGIHSLECSGGIKEARYRNNKNNRYDGIHLYGPSGRKAYTISVLDILKSADILDQSVGSVQSGAEFYSKLVQFQYQQKRKPRISMQQTDRSQPAWVNDRDVRQNTFSSKQDCYNQRYAVPTSNLFDHLNY